MKKIVTIGLITNLFCINLLYGEGNNTAMVISPPKSTQSITAQKERIRNNSKIIANLLAKITDRIADIDVLRVNIRQLMKNQQMEMVCASISSFEHDITSLKEKVSKLTDSEGKVKLEDKMRLYESLLAEEKSILNNYQCPKN